MPTPPPPPAPLRHSPPPPPLTESRRTVSDPLSLSYPLLLSATYYPQQQQEQHMQFPVPATSTFRPSLPPSPTLPSLGSYQLPPVAYSQPHASTSYHFEASRKRASPPFEPAPAADPEPSPPFERETSQEGSASGESSTKAAKKTPDEEWKAKRAAQNRKAQRAFRERRDKANAELQEKAARTDAAVLEAEGLRRRLEEAEATISELRDTDGMAARVAALEREIQQLRLENQHLRAVVASQTRQG